MKYLALIISAISTLGCFEQKAEKTGFEGELIPNFDLQISDTNYYNTINLPNEKPIVVFYFSPNCPYCVTQMDEIIHDIKKLKNIQLCLVTSYSITEMNKFKFRFNLKNYNNIIIGKDTGRVFAQQYKIKGVPFIAIFDKNKKLNRAFLGKVNVSKIKDLVEG